MKEQNGNGFAPSIAQAIEEMKAFQGDSFSLERINLAELERRTGVSRSRLRRLKKNSFQDLPRSTKGSKHTVTKLSGYTGLLDSLCKNRHPSPICTRFEHHFHALKPHLRCLSFKLPRSRSARPYMFKFGR